MSCKPTYKGKRSKDPKIRKRATFADNVRKWKR